MPARASAGIADYVLVHDRAIASRVDDSVVRVMAGAPRVLRRARGYAPATDRCCPRASTPRRRLLALGGELKNTFCLVKDGAAVLSQHIGDLEDAATPRRLPRAICGLYAPASSIDAAAAALDRHPEYLSAKLARDASDSDCRWSRCSTTTRTSRPAWPTTAGRWMRRR